jgi:4-hydroxybenzoate polyprenyltransferase
MDGLLTHAKLDSAPEPCELRRASTAERALALTGVSGLGVGLVAASFLGLCLRCYGQPVDLALLFLGSTMTIASYAIDRVWDPVGSTVRRGTTGCLILGLLAAGWVVEAWLGRPAIAALSTFFPLAVIVYTLPVVPWKYRRIKDIPFAKNIYTAVCWGALAILAAVASRGVPLGRAAGMFLVISSKVLFGAIASDLKDIATDRMRGIRTFANTWGPVRTFAVLRRITVFSALLTVALVIARLVPSFMLVVELPSVFMFLLFAWPHIASNSRAIAACAVLFELTNATAWPLVEFMRAVTR